MIEEKILDDDHEWVTEATIPIYVIDTFDQPLKIHQPVDTNDQPKEIHQHYIVWTLFIMKIALH